MIILEVHETAKRQGRFDGWIDGKLAVRGSTTPFLAAARVLLIQGIDPEEVLLMRHKKTGTDSLKGPIGKAARLRVGVDNSGRTIFKVAETDASEVED